jgi:hypothetical protein
MMELVFSHSKKDFIHTIQVTMLPNPKFTYLGKKYPGPGNYRCKDAICPDGQYFFAKIKS